MPDSGNADEGVRERSLEGFVLCQAVYQTLLLSKLSAVSMDVSIAKKKTGSASWEILILRRLLQDDKLDDTKHGGFAGLRGAVKCAFC